MKTITNNYKENVKLFGREIDSKIIYSIDGETIELGAEELNSVTPHYEGGILKSVMRQLDIDSNVEIPIGTILNYQFGVKVDEEYEYINFGNYIVYSSEKQEDTNSYKIICYDKMLYSMVKYEKMNITYPITIRNYINAICNHLGLIFKNINDTFANYNREIQNELYLDAQGNSLDYTFRDVLDELAQVTASTICINEDDDQLEIRYINNTEDTIDKEYLKDINVNFGEKYGPINSIVLSRSAESDNVYLQDETSIEQNGLCEIKIIDNQIMNFNNRSDYLPDILYKLDGLEYYLNDFSSTGITYYNLCDRYTIQIGEEYYNCVMFNDEINVTQGLEENIHTDIPEETETDYTKADKTDRKINQTYIIVDKQNQAIESVVSQVNSQNNKISQITQTVDEINSKISDIADITVSGESSYASVNLTGINESEPILLKVRPIGDNISYLYPRSNLYPSNTLYSTIRKIRFTNNTTNENFDYILPDNLLYYNSENYDEFNLNYESQTCSVTKKCKYNADGTVSLLSQPIVTNYPYPTIALTEGDYTVSILTYNSGYIYVTLMAKNIYTTQFYTKVETNSIIDQTASSIDLSVNQKLSNYSTTTEMNSAITIKANEINSVVSTKVGNNEVISRINQSAEAITISANKIAISGVISAINNNTTTTINGNKITTGSVSAAQISSNAITSDKIAANAITSAKIATGAINADKIAAGAITTSKVSSDIITTSNFSAQRINADNITSGTISGRTISGGSINGSAISGGSININKSGYYFNMGLSTSHPNCSGLNVGNGGININNLGFNSDGSSFTFSSRINVPVLYASTYLTTNRIEANGGVNIHSGGNDGSYANNGGIYMATGQVSGTPSHITLNAQPGYGFVYAEGNGTPRGRVAIDSSGPSSRCLKDNIKDYTNEEYSEALKLLDDIKIYNYDYKYNIHPKENQYGFIIDDLLENKLADKFLYFKDETAGVMKDGRLDYSANEKENQSNLPIIDFKRYDEETLIKYLLVVCKALQIKINKMEEKNGK